MRRLAKVMLVCTGLLGLGFSPASADRSPVFGQAEVSVMAPEAANAVTARGAYADYYGYYAVENAYSAYIYAYYARYYAAANSTTEQNWYYTAHQYAYYAYLYSYYAYYYSFYRM